MKVVITEKYNQGEVVANSIMDSPNKQKQNGEPLWMGQAEGEMVFVVPLSGQIFDLTNVEARSGYPDFPELEWVTKPRFKKKVDLLKDLLSKADEVVIGSDYDREGELIGTLAVLIPMWGSEDYQNIHDWDTTVTRMEYSAMVEHEIAEAWDDRGDPDEDLFMMGMARARIDFRVGINLSKGLSQCLLRARGEYKTLSAGRVQTPTLKIVHDRCKKRNDFKSKTYWTPQIEINTKT